MKPTQHGSTPFYSLRYPLSFLGVPLGRNVSIFRLQSGALVLHSTAPFTDADRQAIEDLGDVTAIVEATNFHDTFAESGVASFPRARYFAPAGFPLREKLMPEAIAEGQEIWGDELIWIPLEGVPRLNEWACFHPASQTLVVADLVFHCRPTDIRGKLFFAVARIRGWPGNCRLFRLCIKERNKLEKSLRSLLSLDFARLVVAHGDPIEENAKAIFRSALERAFPRMDLREKSD